MSTGHIVVDGAICKCKFGFAPDVLVVQSQQKEYINDSDGSKKLIASTMDLGMPFKAKTFGQCKLQPTSSSYLPCVPAITQWQDFYDKVILSNQGHILTENSKGICAISGSPSVEFTWHGQTAETGSSNVEEADEEIQSHLNPLVNVKEMSQAQETISGGVFDENMQEQENLKFKAYFSRTYDYSGTFGFDWMRYIYILENDRRESTCNDYEKLKTEYTPFKIEGKEYFVPWLSMFPKQKGVELRLTVRTYNDYIPITEQDIVKLPSKNGIRFEPNEVKVSEADMQDVLIKVYCDDPLTEDTTIELKDKDNTIVGKIHFLKNSNHEDLHFEIIPIRVLRGQNKDSDAKDLEDKIDEGFKDLNKDLKGNLQNLQQYLNTQSLNQGLLQCNIGKVYDLVINEEEWLEDGLIIEENNNIFLGDSISKFTKEFENKYPLLSKKRGLFMFLSPLQNKEIAGQGELNDIDGNKLVIYESGLSDPSIFAHEISHVLGLSHSFQKYAKRETIDMYNEEIKRLDRYYQNMLDANTPKKIIAQEWKMDKEQYKFLRSYLNIYYRNKVLTFDQATTENFMDYPDLRDSNNQIIRKNPHKKISYHKYQWKAMQDDVVKFYSKKKL